MKGLSVVVPTFNEAENLTVLVPRIEASIKDLGPHEIIVVDDSSPDGTAKKADALSGRYPVHTLRRKGVRSLSGSVIDGAREATFDCIAVLDADLSHEPESLPQIVSPILRGEVDVAIGSRYIERGTIESWPIYRRLLSWSGTALARRVIRVRDPLSGFFACRRELLSGGESAVRPCGYKILLEVLGRTGDLRVVEVPTVFSDRVAGKSKLGLRQQWEFISQLMSLFVNRAKGVLKTEVWHVKGIFSTKSPKAIWKANR
jgi:dolichol-phosphate mannosyltransferase